MQNTNCKKSRCTTKFICIISKGLVTPSYQAYNLFATRGRGEVAGGLWKSLVVANKVVGGRQSKTGLRWLLMLHRQPPETNFVGRDSSGGRPPDGNWSTIGD